MRFSIKTTHRMGKGLRLFWVVILLILSVALSKATANAHWWGTHFEMVKCAISILKEHVYCECPDHYQAYLKELINNKVILENAVRDVDLQTNGVYAIDCGCEDPTEDVNCSSNGCRCSGDSKSVCNNIAEISDFVFGSHYYYSFHSGVHPSEIYFAKKNPKTGKTNKERLEEILKGYEASCVTVGEPPHCFKETRSDGKLYRKLKGKTVTEKMDALKIAIDEMDAEVLAELFFNRAVKEWSWDETQTDRRKNAIRNLGFALHLVQDVSVPEHVNPLAEEFPGYEKYIWECYLQGGKRQPPLTEGDFSRASPREWIRKTAKTTYGWGKEAWKNPENSADKSFSLGTKATVGMLFSFFLYVRPTFCPYIDKDVSFINCCQYSEWKAREKTEAYGGAGKESGIVGAFKIGEKVEPLAVEAHVVPTRFIVHKKHSSKHGNYKPGDVLLVFTYLGEGLFRVRFEGTMYVEDLGFSAYGGTGGKRCEEKGICWGELERELEIIWWVKLKGASGLSGWSDKPLNFD